MKRRLKVFLGVLGVFVLLFLTFVVTLWFVFAPENWHHRKARFGKAAEKGKLVVDAIKAYESNHGTLPPSLAALIPAHLKSVPLTGLRDYPTFEYLVFTNSKSSLVWYDLGSRKGKPMAGLWVYIEGEPEHAILALTLDQDDRVVDARADRMPEKHQQADFDAEKWKRNESRIEMVRSLPRYVSLEHKPFTELKEFLGEPAGMRILRNSPWELRIECSNGILNWDVFFYWPTKDYPQNIYGGSTERIGEWAYVHE